MGEANEMPPCIDQISPCDRVAKSDMISRPCLNLTFAWGPLVEVKLRILVLNIKIIYNLLTALILVASITYSARKK